MNVSNSESQLPEVRFKALTSLRNDDFRRFWFSSVGRSAGQGTQTLTIAWLVLELTGSISQLGLSVFAMGVPMSVMMIFGGVLADRVSRIKLIMASQLVSITLLALLGVLNVLGVAQVWHVYAVAPLIGAFQGLVRPASTTIISDLVDRPDIMNAVALNSTLMNVSQIAGPSIAGFIISGVGVGAALLVSASFYVVGWAEDHSVTLEVVELDVADSLSVKSAVASIMHAVDYLDVVVNNAGFTSRGAVEAFSLEQIQALFDVNVFGAMRVNKAVLPAMRARKSGLIIHITSTLGRVVTPGPYSASKFAMEALAESLHYQLAPFGIDAVIIEPGAFPTGAMQKSMMPEEDEVQAQYDAVAPGGMGGRRLGQRPANLSDPQQIADTVSDIIHTSAGKRPLRTVVGTLFTAGVTDLNEAYEESRKRLWLQ